MILVKHLLSTSAATLETVPQEAALIEAARRLRNGTDIVAICDRAGCLAGIVTKSDVVERISECHGASCVAPVAAAMTTDVVCCQAEDLLRDVWGVMRERGLKNVPIVDAQHRPVGLVTAREALQPLLQSVEHEETLLRDYVACVGYR